MADVEITRWISLWVSQNTWTGHSVPTFTILSVQKLGCRHPLSEAYISSLVTFSHSNMFAATSPFHFPQGKTLVAAKLCQHVANSSWEKVIVFTAQGIPLVFQQAAYLEAQTNLRVQPLCGAMEIHDWEAGE
jgi:hypothetical protein